jgi:alkanesulfonate monooxygenase SsuD/methylene tetrahydromethanopterin reductase-like flavin-dependent oxidoreductase (luciferase family)
MKFGIAYEISVPRPWTRESEKTVYDRCLEQVRLADQLGFDFIWAVEHHFLEEYSHCSSPELFLSACAMITQRIRLGFGIVVCVPEYSSPIRIAERTATLDILSGGRLEVGTGRSATWTELGGFRANPDDTKKTWDEFVHCIPKMWTQERYSYQGVTWSMPQRTILPKPYQKPHPPLWVAVTSPGTEIDAAERGLGSLGLTFGTVEEQAEKLNRYRRIIRECDPVGEFVNEQVATINFLYCHEDNAQGVATGRRITDRFVPLATQFVHNPEAIPTSSGASQGLLATLRRQASTPGAAPPGIAIGNPERITRELKRWEEMGVDCVNFVLNVLEVVPQEEVLQSLRLFAREVMPHFKEATAETEDHSRKSSEQASATAAGN